MRCLVSVVAVLLVATAGGEPLSVDRILDEADARIDRYRKGDCVLELVDADRGALPAGSTVAIEQTRHHFLFGCNLFVLNRCGSPEADAAYAERFAALFNFATLPFYWPAYEREQGAPDHARTEELIAWCREQGITPKGHPLAWNFFEPSWLPDDSAEVVELQAARVEECVARFRDDIRIWDVVNEATDFDRAECRDRAPRLTMAIQEAGRAEFVRRMFRVARAANPGATLLINDYHTGPRYASEVITNLVGADGKRQYDVIGIQSHQHGGTWPPERVWEVCERFAVFGRPLHFTETTFLSGKEGWELRKKEGAWESTPEGERRQAEDAARFYTILFSHPAVEAITWWDFCDSHAWQGAPAGFLRGDMTPKPIYDRLRELIRERWWSRETVAIDGESRVSPRLFHGEYQVRVESPDGTLRKGTFAFAPGTRAPIRVVLEP